MKSPLISIIIPVYNAEKTITTAVQSILNNDYPNLEIILIDDGSRDHSLKICQQLAESRQQLNKNPKQLVAKTKKQLNKSQKTTKINQNPTRTIQVLHQSNSGPSAARNLGLRHASGEYICFVDADDEVAPTFISTLASLITKPNTALAGTGMLRRRLDRTAKKASTAQNLYRRHLRPKKPRESRQDYILWLLLQDGRLYPVANKIFHASIIRQHHLRFNEQLTFAEDTEFVLKYLAHALGTIRFDLRPLYIYNLDRTTGTVGPAARHWQNWQTSLDFVSSWLKNPTKKTRRLYKLLKLRWHISHLLAKIRK